MKRLYTAGIATLALMALAGCNDTKEFAESLERTIVLTATHEGVSPDTKTLRMDDCSTWWNPKEEISVFYGSGSNGGSKFTSKNTTIAETTEFEGSISMSGSKEFWAVYPYSIDNSCDGSSIITVIPSQQTGVEGNFSNDAFPAIGKSGSLSMPFWNICSGVKFFVSRSDINSVTFKGNNGEVLAGKVKIGFGADGKPEVVEVIEGQTEVTLTAPDGGAFKAGKYYYMTLLPASLDGGFTMTFTTASETGTLKSDKQQTIKRSVFGTLKNIDSKVSEWERSVVEPEWVDLGLSVKWATFNIGATKPEEYGHYFAWGETEPKTDYSWSTYKWCNGSYNTLTKYNDNSSYGTVDNKTVLDPEDDAAHVNWGGSWRMPTDEEWAEIRTKCTWTRTSLDGVNGRLVTGPNGQSIFLPAAGRRTDTGREDAGLWGYYWSSSSDAGGPWSVYFISVDAERNNYYRFRGFSVRPVYGEIVPVSSISLDRTSLELNVRDIYQLTATVSPSNATARDVHWVSSDKDVATVDANGLVTAIAAGTATITAYGSSGVSASCTVSVIDLSLPASVEAVDLGLPSGLKWATMNVGATKPEDYGEYFAWGETEPKSDYRWSTYKWCNGDYNKITKYCTQSSYWDSSNPMDNKTILDPEDDAAQANWGGSWRMPTDAEWAELRENSTWTWTYDYNGTGIAGQVVAASNGNSLFLPAAGGLDYTSLYSVGSFGYYWSSALRTGYPYHAWDAWYVLLGLGGISKRGYERCCGYSIRPVFDDRIHPVSVTLDKSDISLYVGASEILTATVLPDNATDKSITWSSSDESVATVNQDGLVFALAEGTTTITAHSYNGLSASCTVTVKLNLSKPDSVEAVDLGLPSGLKWATMNVGATKPEEYGAYFAWGETEPKTDYSWSTYKWCNGSSNTQTKYNTMSTYGTVDNNTVLDPEDDAAHVNWGGSWRIPTDEEWTELMNNCTWTWTTENGVNGRKVTGPNGKSIFLPAAGLRGDTSLDNAGSDGNFWSSSLYTDYPSYAYYVYFYSSNVFRGYYDRYYGQSVRPVSE